MNSLMGFAFLLLLGMVASEQTMMNMLNPENGDMGGVPFALRSEFETFLEVDANGDLSAYGFYVPTLQRLGLDNPNPFGPPSGAALKFDASSLANPWQLPYDFVLLNFNPGGHPPLDWLIPHFDMHLYMESPEFARGIECYNSTFPPCFLTPYMAALYAKAPPADQLPTGYIAPPDHWVPTMGAHWVPDPISSDFATIPANLYGSYNGKVIYHEPMVASSILMSTEAGTPVTFTFPVSAAYSKDGSFYSQYQIETVQTPAPRYKITFNNLISAKAITRRGTKIFTGAAALVSGAFTNNPSNSKNCLIEGPSQLDGGFLVESQGEEYCCRSQGNFVGGNCLKTTCTGVADLTNPASAFLSKAGDQKCYARCFERV